MGQLIQLHRSRSAAEPAGHSLQPASAEPRIWALAGGKGGVGKSVVACNLAIALADRGRSCALVDLDLGAANAHTLLGLANPPLTLSDFLAGEVANLSEVLCQTPVANLRAIVGCRALSGMANPGHARKEKILRHLRLLDVEEVILDLGAGSSFNTLDFFLAAHRRVVVLAPEPTSVENASFFLKQAFLRSLRNIVRSDSVRPVLEEILGDRARHQIGTPRELLTAVERLDPAAGKELRERAEEFRPGLIVNQASTAEHRRIGREIAIDCQRYLGAELSFLGALPCDRAVLDALQQGQPVLHRFPRCEFSLGIEQIAEKLIEDPQRPRSISSAAPALPPIDVSAPGDYLRRCREALGLRLDELSRRTRIRGLDRLESECFSQLPPEPYLRGFVLQYARELGIAEGEALAASFIERYRQASAPQP